MALKDVFSIMIILIMICAIVAVIVYGWMITLQNPDLFAKIISITGMSLITVGFFFLLFLIWLGYRNFSR